MYAIYAIYMPISWGGLGGQCRHIWQSHGVSGKYLLRYGEDGSTLRHVGAQSRRVVRRTEPEKTLGALRMGVDTHSQTKRGAADPRHHSCVCPETTGAQVPQPASEATQEV